MISFYHVAVCSLLMINIDFSNGGKPILCYMMSTAVQRPIAGKFTVRDVDTSLCTHLVYAYMGLNETTGNIVHRNYKSDIQEGQLLELQLLKQTNPHLKILLSVGGWSEGSSKFSTVMSSSRKMANFISSAVELLRTYSLDGIDVCWRYPTLRGGSPDDKDNFSLLLRNMRRRFNTDGFILTVRLSAKKNVFETAYDIEKISEQVHFINLATFDYNGPWDHKVGIHAPLFSEDENNVFSSVKAIINKGANPSKILLGLATYGRTYLLKNQVPDEGNFVGLEADYGPAAALTGEKGYIGYNEVCYDLKKVAWVVQWDRASRSLIGLKGKTVISYENINTIKHKVNLINEMDLGGAMIWTIDTDDFRGLCESVKYPLLRSVNARLNSKHSGPNLPPEASNSVVSRPNTPQPPAAPIVTQRPTQTTDSNIDIEVQSGIYGEKK